MENLQNILANDYCGIDNFLNTVILPVMQCGIERKNIDLLDDDNKRANAALSNIKSILHVGTLDWMGSSDIEVYDVTLRDNAKISRSRVGIQSLIKSNLFPFSHAFMVFHYDNPAYRSWRFSYCFKQDSLNNTTPAKRFTYLFGRDFPCRTAVDRLNLLARSKRNDKDLEEAFSVQALSDEFFYKYLGYYAVFTEYITGIRVEKAKLDRKEIKEIVRWFEQTECYQKKGRQFTVFNNNEKKVSDYVKKMLGRIVFLYFLEHKGWLAGNHNYMRDLLANVSETDKEDFLDKMLEPMFFGLLNTKTEDRRQLLINGVSPSSLPQADAIPYLNGGLFQQEEIDLINSDFPYELFKALFDFFDSYNFTIDENDPDDAEVGVDPEMLGKIFESLLEDNKDKGAFYTPKEIVDYMCQESLIAYLQTNVNDEAVREGLRRFVETRNVDSVNGTGSTLARKIDTELQRVKICDPAIGSGAFPMGLLNLLVKCREALGCRLTRVELKREIIQNNIYGVDIEKGAVDIARLRFWLSLIVDEDTPQALPNLDYKIVEGNSLLTTFDGKYINLDTKGQQHFRVNEMREEKRKLYQLKKNFYGAYGAQKMEITIAIKDSILRLIAMQLGYESRSWLSKNTEQLDLFEARQLSLNDMLPKLPEETQRIFEHCNMLHRRLNDKTISLSERAQTDIRFFDWRVIFTEVFDNETPGFDIVIGNPPYVEAKKLKHVASILKPLFEVYSGTADLSIYFIEHGKNLLAENGILSYITTNKFFNTGYGKLLRKLIISNKINKIINFEQVEVFEGVLVSSVILEIRKSESTNEDFTYDRFYKLNSTQFKKQFVARIGSFGSYPSSELDENEWSFSDVSSLKVKRQIEKRCKLLGEIEGVNIYRGVTTGYNPAFIINNEKRDQLIAEDPKNASVIKNMLQGRNIRKWYYNESDENLVFVPWHFPLHKDESISGASKIAEERLSVEYKALYNHLLYHKEELADRNHDETGIRYEWYALQRCAASYYEEFEKPEKIIWGLTADKWAYALDTEGHYLPSNGYILTSTRIPIKYILGLLNSALLQYYFSFIGIMTAGGAYTLKAATISALPFVDTDNYEGIISIVDRILSAKKLDPQADTSALEAEIDRLVYQLYGLTYDEVKIVDPETPITREEYESK